jgi:hypothetical protein
MILKPILICCVSLFTLQTLAQCPLLSMNEVNSFASICTGVTLTSLPDQLGRPYLYVASKEEGLKVVDIQSTPQQVAQILTSSFSSLHVNSITQQGYYLFLAVGNSFNNGQSAGLVVIDVNDPENPVQTDFEIIPASSNGSGMVYVKGNRAYLAGMSDGVGVFDVSDVFNVNFIAQFIPDINFPVQNPDPEKVNARCILVEDNFLYLCYDAGGLRVLDITDENNISEIGHYSNPELDALPRAYNNLVKDGQYLYVTVDYCGIEVIDVSNTSSPGLASWWNPWDCASNPFNWFSSPGHTNELVLKEDCDVLFVATGKSDMYVLDVSNPLQPDSCDVFGGVDNNMGTWGVSMRGDSVYLSYVCAVIPFASNWTGIKVIDIETNCTTDVNGNCGRVTDVYPVPSKDQVFIVSDDVFQSGEWVDVMIYDESGRKLQSGQYQYSSNGLMISLEKFSPGLYFANCKNKVSSCRVKLIRQ